jgi:hypothetical protein
VKDERYYRTIADRFIALRGAPFAISPADISLISSWESAGIPLDVVLEGIRDAFSLRPGKAHAPGKVRTLSFCRPAVERAFERYRERSVGGHRPSAETASSRKRKAAWAAVEEFLTRRPPELRDVLPYYEAALAYLSAERPDTEALERLDERIEAALLSVAEPSGSEAARVKKLRRILRIPYVSPFYY